MRGQLIRVVLGADHLILEGGGYFAGKKTNSFMKLKGEKVAKKRVKIKCFLKNKKKSLLSAVLLNARSNHRTNDSSRMAHGQQNFLRYAQYFVCFVLLLQRLDRTPGIATVNKFSVQKFAGFREFVCPGTFQRFLLIWGEKKGGAEGSWLELSPSVAADHADLAQGLYVARLLYFTGSPRP